MRIAASLAAIVLIGALAAPEVARYAAERRVGWATTAFRAFLEAPKDPETQRRLPGLGAEALSTTESLPGDSRPWMIAASTFLLTGQPAQALELYREAFSTGERAEIDLNLGRAYAALARRDSAEAAFLRAGWVSPEILSALPEAERARLSAEITRRSEELARGRLLSAPPLPEEERR